MVVLVASGLAQGSSSCRVIVPYSLLEQRNWTGLGPLTFTTSPRTHQYLSEQESESSLGHLAHYYTHAHTPTTLRDTLTLTLFSV